MLFKPLISGFNYQLSCGYALLKDNKASLAHMRKALKLYPYFKKFIEGDEMLDDIRGDIIAEKLDNQV